MAPARRTLGGFLEEDVDGSTPTISSVASSQKRQWQRPGARVRMFVPSRARIVLFLRAVVVGVVTPRAQNKIASTRKSEGTPTMSWQIVQNKCGSWNKPSRFWAETVHNQQG